MGAVRVWWRNLSLRTCLVCYVAAFTVLALALCVGTSDWCTRAVDAIYDSYENDWERYYLTNEEGERLGEGAYIGKSLAPVSERDERLVALLAVLPTALTPVYSACCIVAAVFCFYRSRLKGPLAELMLAAEKIAASDLDFQMSCQRRDEMGRLCAAFEVMRATLAENFSKMWRQVEERKRLNAAFAHDLRTPLTVLKGYGELLAEDGDAQTREIAGTMGRHIGRMEQYVEHMAKLQRLEDLQPAYRKVRFSEMAAQLCELSRVICGQAGKQFVFQEQMGADSMVKNDAAPEWSDRECSGGIVEIDMTFVSEICSNLISNAVRYTQTQVTLCLERETDGLVLTVMDDGTGFEEEFLRDASKAYVSGESGREHFGLGLYICRVLCENHGGFLEIGNTDHGAKVRAHFQETHRKFVLVEKKLK